MVESNSGRVMAQKDMSEPGVAAVAVELSFGTYDVEMFGAFGNMGAMSEGSEAIQFLQKSHCNVTEWHPLLRGALAVCTPDPPAAPAAPPPPPLVFPADWDEPGAGAPPMPNSPLPPLPDSPEAPPNSTQAAPDSPEDAATPKDAETSDDDEMEEGAAAVSVEEHPRARDTEVDEDTGKAMAVEPKFDGAFMSLKIGGLDLMDPLGLKDALMDQYILFQGRFTLLGFSIEIDFSIKPGSMEDGGGFKFSFYFSWGVEVGRCSLTISNPC